MLLDLKVNTAPENHALLNRNAPILLQPFMDAVAPDENTLLLALLETRFHTVDFEACVSSVLGICTTFPLTDVKHLCHGGFADRRQLRGFTLEFGPQGALAIMHMLRHSARLTIYKLMINNSIKSLRNAREIEAVTDKNVLEGYRSRAGPFRRQDGIQN